MSWKYWWRGGGGCFVLKSTFFKVIEWNINTSRAHFQCLFTWKMKNNFGGRGRGLGRRLDSQFWKISYQCEAVVCVSTSGIYIRIKNLLLDISLDSVEKLWILVQCLHTFPPLVNSMKLPDIRTFKFPVRKSSAFYNCLLRIYGVLSLSESKLFFCFLLSVLLVFMFIIYTIFQDFISPHTFLFTRFNDFDKLKNLEVIESFHNFID